ncbi:MAG TPA: putative sulfate exporter family transporter, partial [Deinococcales bacterium]|nr:putative sulfate exporter family transporter [Deinococcales bacterium]
PETPGQTGPQLPPFLYGFLALGVLASTGLVPDVLLAASESASLVLTGTAMAAIGLNLEPQALRRNGSRAVAAAAGGFGAAAAAAAAALWLAGLL